MRSDVVREVSYEGFKCQRIPQEGEDIQEDDALVWIRQDQSSW